jgi:scyllo-inositol 2-dehydrogenase (NADP+)
LTVVEGEVVGRREVESVAGDYLRFFEGVRGAISGGAMNPVSASEAVGVMRLIQTGIEAARLRRELATSL